MYGSIIAPKRNGNELKQTLVDHKMNLNYRKSSIRSRPLIQVYPIRGRNILSDTTQIYYQNFDFCVFLGSLGDPLSPNEKIFSIKLIIFKVPLIQV